MPGSWNDSGRLHRALAEIDARTLGSPAPRIIGFHQDRPLAQVALRPFASGETLDPVVEALAFLLPFGATQLSVSLPGRAWSQGDPIPPVTRDVDLRQRVLTELRASTSEPFSSVLHPFSMRGEAIQWDPPREVGPAEGQLARVLGVAVGACVDWDGPAFDVVDQLARIGARGHEIALAPDGERRLRHLVDALDSDATARR